MNTEEPVFCIIHNYRRPEVRQRRHRDPFPPLEIDSDQLDAGEPISTDDTLASENAQPGPDR
jgi:hypothetical protein